MQNPMQESARALLFSKNRFFVSKDGVFFMNIINGLKLLTIFTIKLHLRCFTRFFVCLCSEFTSSIYQRYKFKVYCNSFWRHCNVFGVVFACINETICPLSNVTLSKNLELLCNFMFATNTKTIIYIT